MNAEVEPSLGVNPVNPTNLVGAWQQDRWSNGGARGVLIGTSSDGGHTWTTAVLPFSRCTGGNAGNDGDFERATDPWVTFSPSGVAYVLALVFSGQSFTTGSSSAMRVTRSTDGGATWSAPQTLILDGAQILNDKGSITADPTDPHLVYSVWDRLTDQVHAASEFVRSTDGGMTWEPARAIYDPGADNQTIGNIITVLPDGTLLNVFSEIDSPPGGATRVSLRTVRSTDHGTTWSAPIQIAEELSVGTTDPNTGAALRDAGDLESLAIDASGTLYVVWQDARFSSGARDGVAMSRSVDGGVTWSAPVQVNADMATEAFVPTVRVRADGVIGVTYYDFRNAGTSMQTLPTDYWIVTSSDATHFTESHVTGPFDLEIAPNDTGLFLGDYQSLQSAGSDFLPFFARTNDGDNANPTDIFVAMTAGGSQPAPVMARSVLARSSMNFVMNAQWQRRIAEHAERVRRARLFGHGP